ncbi:MAG: AMP-dependent synthetase/ligase [Egibacteraceae bacterium]
MVRTQIQGPAPFEVEATHNLTTRLWERAAQPGAEHILCYPTSGGWAGLSWGELGERVRAAAAGLIAIGVQPGDRVALMSSTRLEWTIADLAILSAGAVTVPIYETNSSAQCGWILADSGAKAVIAGTDEQAKRLDAARDKVTALGEIFVIDEGGLDVLAERADDAHRAQVAERAAAPRQSDLATIVYTSGTTGNPKGCMITHGNLLWTARQFQGRMAQLLGSEACTLLFLPLAHIVARGLQFLCLESGVRAGYARSLETIAHDIASFRPTFLAVVPRVLEKVFNIAQRKASSGAKAKVFDLALRTSQQWSLQGRRDPAARLGHAVADKLVYAKVRHALGGRLRYCLSGSAPLAPHLAAFFDAAGMAVLEGYGLTETSAPATVNSPEQLRIGTVGLPLPGVEVQIADDGEILLRGRNIFTGYYHNEAATQEALSDDGWLHTGDIGELDDEGFLRITGRKKELIVTAGGKNVAPAVLEERLKEHRLVSQAMVVGDRRPFVACLVTLEPDELSAFAAERGLSGSAAQLAESDAVQAEVAKAVEHANAAVSKAESIRRWRVLSRDFTLEHGEITPTLKIRRDSISEHFATEIESLYVRSEDSGATASLGR